MRLTLLGIQPTPRVHNLTFEKNLFTCGRKKVLKFSVRVSAFEISRLPNKVSCFLGEI